MNERIAKIFKMNSLFWILHSTRKIPFNRLKSSGTAVSDNLGNERI